MKTFQKLTDLIDPPEESTCCFVLFFRIQEAGMFPGVSVVSGDNRLAQTDSSFFILLEMNSSGVV